MAGGGTIFSGANPIVFNTANPIPLFIIQALIIICFSRFLAYPLGLIRQPTVIAEVVGGVLLGPSVMGHIPNFSSNIFPKDSLPFLGLVANLGLIFFLFMVGLELDMRSLRRNFHRAILISVAGMCLPFGLGIAVSYALFQLLGDNHDVPFTSFFLFLGVAMAITAFPVLARILTELKLLRTFVGSITLSAAAIDDVTSWCLLALVVAIINAKSGLVILWTIMCVLGFALFMLIIGRSLMYKFLVYTNSFESGPSQRVMFVIFAVVLASAWFTEIIGVHAIFGGFLAGVIIPHDHGLAVHITEKIEDLVSVVFLPLYFALSGLKTNLGSLDDGLTWGLLVLVIVVACGGKIIGCTIAARFSKLNWRESISVGVLMNCKGLVELIVLNIGYDAGVINTRIFTMMVVMALITTFVTTPLIHFIYPPRFQRLLNDVTSEPEPYTKPVGDEDAEARPSFETTDARSIAELIHRPLSVLVCLNKMQHVPALMALMQFLNPPHAHEPGNPQASPSTLPAAHRADTLDSSPSPSDAFDEKAALAEIREVSSPLTGYFTGLRVYALRLIALTQRNSAVMMSTESEDTMRMDPLMSMFRTFGLLNNISVRSALSVCPTEDFAETLASNSDETRVNYAIVPWSGSGGIDDDQMASPLDYFFNRGGPKEPHQGTSPQHLQFISEVFRRVSCNVAVFIDRGFDISQDAAINPTERHLNGIHSQWTSDAACHAIEASGGRGPVSVFVPFFGGADDRAAVYFALRFAANPNIHISIVRFIRSDELTANDAKLEEKDFVEASNQMTIQRGQQLASLPRAAVRAAAASAQETDHSGISPLSGAAEASVLPYQNTTLQLQSNQADELLFHKLFHTAEALERDPRATHFTLDAYPNVSLELVEASTPLQTAIVRGRDYTARDLVILGRSRGLGPGHKGEIETMLAGNEPRANGTGPGYQPVESNQARDSLDAANTSAGINPTVPVLAHRQNPKYRMLGDGAERFLAANCRASLIVLQSKSHR
ncbi:K(+)/H(+) antiporter [Dimargaris cristalligena]|nr:K(+)/H(+) antiporter [Dimargaris cristalligena]